MDIGEQAAAATTDGRWAKPGWAAKDWCLGKPSVRFYNVHFIEEDRRNTGRLVQIERQAKAVVGVAPPWGQAIKTCIV